MDGSASKQGVNNPLIGLQFAPCAPSALPTVQRVDFKLKPFDFAQAVARAGLATNGQPLAKPKAVAGASFESAMAQALADVSRAQNQASAIQRNYQLGVAGVSEEQAVLSMVKAQVGFQAVLGVRNRMVQAYTDIMNMQV